MVMVVAVIVVVAFVDAVFSSGVAYNCVCVVVAAPFFVAIFATLRPAGA